MSDPVPRRLLPSVDSVLHAVPDVLAAVSRPLARRWANEALTVLRTRLASGAQASADRQGLLERAAAEVRVRMQALNGWGPKRVINASGVILHTNLGRAPLAPEAVNALTRQAAGYCDLEYDLGDGRRGHRDAAVAGPLGLLWPGVDATAVNNNAAAVLLAIHALAQGGEVIVSRGELVEIGGSFRIPDIMSLSGASLREVGTTNRTRVSDYRAAIDPATRLLLQVHRSNFELVGFTETPPVAELAAVARQHGLPLLVDAGSGWLAQPGLPPMRGEVDVAAALAAGADLVCFSGDKLLGGPQAGILVGRPERIAQLRHNPLMRAFRLDKLRLAALAETLKLHLRPDARDRVPVLEMLSVSADALRARSLRFRRRLVRRAVDSGSRVRVRPGVARAGGGAMPREDVPGWVVSLGGPDRPPERLERHLRASDPPVVARMAHDELLIDLRTVSPAEEAELLAILVSAGVKGFW